jgi:hypothetical protein
LKKRLLFSVVCFVVLPFSVYAQEKAVWEDDVPWAGDGYIREKEDTVREDIEYYEYPEEEVRIDEPKEPFHIKNRMIEIGMANIDVGFANNFLAASNFFQETFVIDLDEFKKGLNMSLNFMFSPFHFQFNKNDNWGFGLTTKIEGMLFASLAEDMLSLNEIIDEESDIGGGIFAETGINAFFHVKQFKIKIKPTLYFPIIYVKQPAVSYTRTTVEQDGNEETILDISWTMRTYTIGSFEDVSGGFDISATPGFDFYLGVEYPLAKILGLSERFKFLDFDVGLDLIHVPLIPSIMKDYVEVFGNIGDREEPIDILNVDTKKLINISGDPEYGQSDLAVLRPFKLLTWADWRPFGGPIFTVTPLFGFAINPLFTEIFNLEGGLKLRLDIVNLFLVTLGVNYEDRLWKNSLAFVLNFRAVEFDFEIDIRSQDFLKSWMGAGVGMVLGLKFGW